MAELDVKEKLKKFAQEMGMDDDALENLLITLTPLIDKYVLLSIQNTLGDGLLNAMHAEAEKRNYSPEDAARYVIFAYEKQTNKPIIHLVEEYLSEFIKEMTKSKRLLQGIINKVIASTKPELWESELNSYAQSLDDLVMNRNDKLLQTEAS